ncbi:hypothetical protein AB0I24_16240 [Brachybacterium paraconglomeratum]
MGWLADIDNPEAHEGYVAMLDTAGRGTGTSTGAGILFPNPRWTSGSDEEFDSLVPWREVAGWRAECECGWQGSTWLRGDASPDDPAEEDTYPDHWILPDGRTVDQAGHEEWREHVGPSVSIEGVRRAAQHFRDAEAALDDAVAQARSCDPPVSWEQIGRAYGITRQSAHDRWAPREATRTQVRE